MQVNITNIIRHAINKSPLPHQHPDPQIADHGA